jgi:hypothetical protein
MPSKIAAAKNFVSRHRVALAVSATAIVLTAAHIRIIAQHNEFLSDHDLLDKFYSFDEED